MDDANAAITSGFCALILRLIRCGFATQAELVRESKGTIDEVGIALAELMIVHREIYSREVNGHRFYYEVPANLKVRAAAN
jgi:hypothetical protein